MCDDDKKKRAREGDGPLPPSKVKKARRGALHDEASDDEASDDEANDDEMLDDGSGDELPSGEARFVALEDDEHGVALDEQTELWITVIDVAQGESTLVRYRKNNEDVKVVLIDGGRARYAADSIAPTLRALGVERIHVAICTHYDTDHLEGLTALAPLVPIARMYERSTTARREDAKVDSFRRTYARRLEVARREAVLCEEDSFSVQCVAVDNERTLWSDENDYSIGVLVKLGKFKYFTGGDLTSEVENGLGPELGHVCAFKCGHHGSKHSSNQDFINRITPSAALISAGRHSYCHPDDELIDVLCASDSIQQLYLTNCCYNRAGINPEFATSEDELIQRKLGQLKEHASEAFRLGAGAVDDALAILNFRDVDLEALSDRVAASDLAPSRDQLAGVEGEARTALRGAIEAYLVAKDMIAKKDERGRRRPKGVVASTNAHLGNIHLVVSGRDADDGCRYTVHVGANAYDHRCGVDVAESASLLDVSVARIHEHTPAFSLPTGLSGEKREALTPDEIDVFTDAINQLLDDIQNEAEGSPQIVELRAALGDSRLVVADGRLAARFRALLVERDEVQEDFPDYDLKDIAAEVESVLPEEESDSDEEFSDWSDGHSSADDY